PEKGYRSCLALIRDAKRYEAERVEAACRRALAIGAPTRRSVLAILKNGLDRVPLELDDERQLPLPVAHENVRGGDYYATGHHAHELEEKHDDDRRGDVSQTVRDEATGDGRGFPRIAEGGPEQPAQLQREDRLHGRQGV